MRDVPCSPKRVLLRLWSSYTCSVTSTFSFILSFCFPPLICFSLHSTSSPVTPWTRDTRKRVGACEVCVCLYTVCAHVRQSARLGHNKRHLQISHMGITITDPTHTRPRAAEPLFTPDAGGLCVPQTQMGPWTSRTGLRPGAFLAVGPGRSALIVVVQVLLTGWIRIHSSFCLSVTAAQLQALHTGLISDFRRTCLLLKSKKISLQQLVMFL